MSLYDDLLRPFKVVKHRVGQSLSSATEIFNEHDASVFVDVSCTKDGKVMLVSKNSKSSSEVFALNIGLHISDKPRVLGMVRSRLRSTRQFPMHPTENGGSALFCGALRRVVVRDAQ